MTKQLNLFDFSGYELEDLIGSQADMSNAKEAKTKKPIKSATIEEQRACLAEIFTRRPTMRCAA